MAVVIRFSWWFCGCLRFAGCLLLASLLLWGIAICLYAAGFGCDFGFFGGV